MRQFKLSAQALALASIVGISSLALPEPVEASSTTPAASARARRVPRSRPERRHQLQRTEIAPASRAELPLSLAETSRKRYAVRVNAIESGLFSAVGYPLGSLVGDVAFGPGFAAGPILAWGPARIEGNGISLGLGSIGAHGTWYFGGRALEDGWLLRAHFTRYLVRASLASSGAVDQASASAGFNALGATIARHWVWRGGLSVTLGIGLTRFSSTTPTVTVSGTDPQSGRTIRAEADLPEFAGASAVVPMPELTLGWAF